MCPALRRQLQTHRNVLRLLHEHKLASTQINGQRILSIQPIRWSGPTPGIECEIFVGRIPKTIYEDTLYPLFKTVGEEGLLLHHVHKSGGRGACHHPSGPVRDLAGQENTCPGERKQVQALCRSLTVAYQIRRSCQGISSFVYPLRLHL